MPEYRLRPRRAPALGTIPIARITSNLALSFCDPIGKHGICPVAETGELFDRMSFDLIEHSCSLDHKGRESANGCRTAQTLAVPSSAFSCYLVPS